MKRFLPLLLLSLLALVAPAPAEPGPPPAADPLGDGVKAVTAYDYGADRAAIVAFDDYIRAQPAADRRKVEAALLPLLVRDDVSVAAKDYVCRWLCAIGSDASVGTIQKLLDDPKLGHLAVYALLSIDTDEAKFALLHGFASTPAPLRPAIIGAVGRAGVGAAVPVLAKIVSSGEAADAEAALDALGDMGTPAALGVLREARVAAPLETARRWALVHAAMGAATKDASERAAAKAALAPLLAPGTAAPLRTAAAKGAMQADPAGAWDVILPLLKDDDARTRLSAARLTPLLSADGLRTLVPALATLDPATQAAVVNVLAQARPAGTGAVLAAALASARPDVRLAAIAGYGTADLPGTAPVLLPLLARGGGEGAAAAASLARLPQPEVPAQIRTALAGAPGPVKAALLTVLAARRDHADFALFLASAGDADPAVAEAAFRGIEATADADKLDRVVDLLPLAKTNAARKSLDAALLRCARTATDKDRASDFLFAARQGAPPEAKGFLLAAIASIHSPKAAASLQSQLSAPLVDDRKDAIRALSSAHTPDADKLLLAAASQGTETSEKILALRGYLDSIQAQNFGGHQKIEAYRTAWPLAIRPEEQQAILDALKRIEGSEARKAVQELSSEAHKPA